MGKLIRVDSFDITYADSFTWKPLKVNEKRIHINGQEARKGVGEKRIYVGSEESKLDIFFWIQKRMFCVYFFYSKR